MLTQLGNTSPRLEPTAEAEAAGLVYAVDTEPGILRRRAGKGFWYVDPGGEKVSNFQTLARIRALAIPPAWTDVWISARADAHIQATGRDDRGRKQYRYHARWTACRDEVKYGSLVNFADTLPELRERIDLDLSRRGLPQERVLASVVWLLDRAMIRVGNASYARDNKSFGLTTLRDRHVDVRGATLRFAFRGKSGKEWRLRISDRRIARVVKGAQDLPGQHLFQYIADDGSRRAVTSQDVNAYIHEATGSDFSSKHFRTWGGTVRATQLLAPTPLPENDRAVARTLNAVIDQVAAHLGNTRTVCRKCYVHPLVVRSWTEGRLGDELTAVASASRSSRERLSREEDLVFRWLQNAEGSAQPSRE